MTSDRRIRFNGFKCSTVAHTTAGLWRHPQSRSHRYKELSFWVELGQDNRVSSLEMRLSLGSLIDIGKLRVIVDKEFSLIEAAQAHELSEAGHVRGKIILNVT